MSKESWAMGKGTAGKRVMETTAETKGHAGILVADSETTGSVTIGNCLGLD